MSKSKDIKQGLEIGPGDSVLVIGSDGKLKKIVVSGLRSGDPRTEGTKKVFEILKLFDPRAKVDTFDNIDRKRMN